MKAILTLRLKWAAEDLTNCDFTSAMTNLKLAMSEANKLKRSDLKSLIMRAMNHTRSAQKIGAQS